MFSRRDLLLTATASLGMLGTGGSGALALSSEPMDPADLSALALACQSVQSAGTGSHAQLLADARRTLDDEIKQGLKPATATELVVCPFCQCSFQVVPDISF